MANALVRVAFRVHCGGSFDRIMTYIVDERSYINLFTYSDVILSLAECDYYLGNTNAAWDYANNVADVRNEYGCNLTPGDDLLKYISAIRYSMPTTLGKFPFLKRTGLAKTQLNLEDYQLLFPIPTIEIQKNPNLTQNPGY